MKAYKCDRCGGIFEEIVSSRYYIHVGFQILDLCEACTWSLADWMNTEKKSEVFSGCNECKYKDSDEHCEPCKNCNRNYIDKFVREDKE